MNNALLNHGPVRTSLTDLGRGVIACRDIPSGSSIGEVTGAVAATPDEDNHYYMDIGDGRLLDPSEPFRYLNHSCDPNAVLHILVCEDSGAVLVHIAVTPAAFGFLSRWRNTSSPSPSGRPETNRCPVPM